MSDVDSETPAVVAALEDFDVFYSREFAPVVSLAFALCGSWSSAEDLAQDAFVSAQRRWSKVGAYDKPGAWVRRVVANRSVSLTRRRLAEARAVLRVSRERLPEPAELTEGDAALWAHVRRLPARQRQVIALHYVNGQSVSDIADMLGLGEPTVKTHLQRGRRSLESRLAQDRGGQA